MTNRIHVASKPAEHQLVRIIATSLALSALYASSMEICYAQAGSHAQSEKQPEIGKSPRRDFHPKVKGLQQSDEIPSNFPVPAYPSNVTSKHFTSTTTGHPAAAATMVTTDPAATALAWYQALCIKENWAVKVPKGKARSRMEEEGRLFRLLASKDNQRMVISCAKAAKGTSTHINISWTTRKK